MNKNKIWLLGLLVFMLPLVSASPPSDYAAFFSGNTLTEPLTGLVLTNQNSTVLSADLGFQINQTLEQRVYSGTPVSFIDRTSNFSISLWLMSTYYSGTDQILANRVTSNGYLSWDTASSGASMRASIRNSAGSGWVDAVSSGALTNGVWYHAVLTWDGTNLLLYLNNVSQSGTSGANTVGTTGVAFGASTDLGSYYSNNNIRNVKMYNRTLTAAEVSELYQEGSTCSVPYDDVTYTESMTLCSGTYYIPDTGNDGVIRIQGDDITLNCQGSELVGSGTSTSIAVKGRYDGYDNITIKDCILKNYGRGVLLSNGENWTISNITSYNSTIGVFINNFPYDASYGNNTVINSDFYDCGDSCIRILGSGKNALYSNFVNSSNEYGFELTRANNTRILYNVLNNTVSNSIRVNNDANWYTLVDSNNVSNSGWNCIDVMGRYSNFTNNLLDNCPHSGLNANTDTNDASLSNNNYIAHNYANNTPVCAYIESVWNSVYENNTCDANGQVSDPNLFSRAITSDGIVNSTGYIMTFNNTVKNNKFFNYAQYGVGDNSINSSNRYENNTFIGVNKTIYIENYYGTGTDTSILYFINNTHTGKNVSVTIGINSTPYKIYVEDYSAGLNVSFPNQRTLILNYSTAKNLTLGNISFNIYNLLTPFDDVYNVSSGSVLAYDQTSYTLTIESSGEYIIGDYGFEPLPNQTAGMGYPASSDVLIDVNTDNWSATDFVAAAVLFVLIAIFLGKIK